MYINVNRKWNSMHIYHIKSSPWLYLTWYQSYRQIPALLQSYHPWPIVSLCDNRYLFLPWRTTGLGSAHWPKKQRFYPFEICSQNVMSYFYMPSVFAIDYLNLPGLNTALDSFSTSGMSEVVSYAFYTTPYPKYSWMLLVITYSWTLLVTTHNPLLIFNILLCLIYYHCEKLPLPPQRNPFHPRFQRNENYWGIPSVHFSRDYQSDHTVSLHCWLRSPPLWLILHDWYCPFTLLRVHIVKVLCGNIYTIHCIVWWYTVLFGDISICWIPL